MAWIKKLVAASLALSFVSFAALADSGSLPQVQSAAAMEALQAHQYTYIHRTDLGLDFIWNGTNCSSPDTLHVQPNVGTGCWIYVPPTTLPNAPFSGSYVAGDALVAGAGTNGYPATDSGVAPLTLTYTDVTPYTPTMAGDNVAGTVAYTRQYGDYSIFGHRAIINFYILTSSFGGSIAGNMVVNLPLTISATSNSYTACTLSEPNGITFDSGYTQVQGFIEPNTNQMYFAEGGSGKSSAFLAVGNFAAVTAIAGTCVVRTLP